jgi:hypothetical protein
MLDKSNARNTFLAPMIVDECAVDADCVVMPAAFSCCGECEPSPPFEASPRSELADLRRTCFRSEHLCEPPVCPSKPAGCEARAVCRSGACIAIPSDGCVR